MTGWDRVPEVHDGDHHLDDHDVDGLPPSWHPAPLAAMLAGNYEPPKPTVLGVAGTGQGLLYKAKTNAIYGDSGAGKTWVALRCVMQALAHAAAVLYVDLEDGPHLFVHRLRLLGVADDTIAGIDYVNPNEPATGVQIRRLAERRFGLVVIDGVTGYYRMNGWDTDAARDADAMKAQLDQFATFGACVLSLDHAGKSRDGRGWALGSQHKRSAITGAAYRIEPVPGQDWNAATGGTHSLIKTKDRPGGVPVRNEDEASRLVMRPGHPTEIAALPGKGWLL